MKQRVDHPVGALGFVRAGDAAFKVRRSRQHGGVPRFELLRIGEAQHGENLLLGLPFRTQRSQGQGSLDRQRRNGEALPLQAVGLKPGDEAAVQRREALGLLCRDCRQGFRRLRRLLRSLCSGLGARLRGLPALARRGLCGRPGSRTDLALAGRKAQTGSQKDQKDSAFHRTHSFLLLLL